MSKTAARPSLGPKITRSQRYLLPGGNDIALSAIVTQTKASRGDDIRVVDEPIGHGFSGGTVCTLWIATRGGPLAAHIVPPGRNYIPHRSMSSEGFSDRAVASPPMLTRETFLRPRSTPDT